MWISPHLVGLLMGLVLSRQPELLQFHECDGLVMLRRCHFATHLLDLGPKLFLFHFLFSPPLLHRYFQGNENTPRLMLFSLDIVSFWRKKKIESVASFTQTSATKRRWNKPCREGRWNNYRYIVFPCVSLLWTLWCWENASFSIWNLFKCWRFWVSNSTWSFQPVDSVACCHNIASRFKRGKKIHSTSNRACLASSKNESENQALMLTWNR